MLEQNSLEQSLENLLTDLCKEALVEDSESNPPVTFYTRAPEGKTIAEGSTTISLNRRAYTLLENLIVQLRKEEQLRIKLSRKELEQEVITSIFEGTRALHEDTFDSRVLVDSLLARLEKGRETWDIYLPIDGLRLPDDKKLPLAGGVFTVLTDSEKDLLYDKYKNIWSQAKWYHPEQAETGIRTLSESFVETLGSSILWYHIQVNGRQQAAKNQAIESALLAMDILTFFALLNGINPEIFSSHFPYQGNRGIMKSLQISRTQGTLHSESGSPFPYTLDSSQYGRLTNLRAFQEVQSMSNIQNINPVQQRVLSGIQQYAEATRLPSSSAKLVWYLSALETVLLKETEYESRKVMKRRITRILGSIAEERLGPLYDKRAKIVHYGYRTRANEEFVTKVDIDYARSISYLGIISVVRHANDFVDANALLDHVDSLPASSKAKNV